MEERLQELDRALLDPAVASDPQQLRRLGQERAELEPVVALWRGHRALEEELAATESGVARSTTASAVSLPRRSGS